jgi:hypothetical protein
MSGTFIQFPKSGGVDTYPTFADFPASASPGTLAVALDTDTLYIYDETSAMWLPVGGTAVPLVVGTIDSATPSANGAVIGSNSLFMQSASPTNPGLVNTGVQSFGGAKTFVSAPTVPGVIYSGSASGQVLTQAAQTSSSVYSLTWPAVQGAANSFPQNDGNGNLTWVPISVSSGSSVQLTMAPLDGAAKSVQGAVIGSNTLFMQTADAIFPGIVSSSVQTFSGIKTFSSAPQFSSLNADLPAVLGSGSVLSSRSLLFGSPDVIGSVSLENQVNGLLPITQTSGSVSLTDKVVGILPAANLPPLSGLTGSVSLTSQVSGILPAANTQPLSSLLGSVSLTSQVSGLLPISQTSGSVSLLNQVREYFPTVTIGSISLSQVAGGALYPINFPSVQGSGTSVLQNNGLGDLSWVNQGTPLTNPMTSPGDMIIGSGSGVAARLAGNTSNSISFLMQVGSASAALAPTWTPFRAPTIQVISSGTGTYSTPTSARYLKVRMVGGGGGGGGSSTSATGDGGNGVAGTSSFFGTSLLWCGGGNFGTNAAGQVGGNASVTAPAIGFALSGGGGGGVSNAVGTAPGFTGGTGGNSAFGGGARGTAPGNDGSNAPVNTGAGGSGGAGPSNGINGGGGGAGGYVEAYIYNPSTSYSYHVGAGGNGGAPGTGGQAGGAGARGIIIIEEHYL